MLFIFLLFLISSLLFLIFIYYHKIYKYMIYIVFLYNLHERFMSCSNHLKLLSFFNFISYLEDLSRLYNFKLSKQPVRNILRGAIKDIISAVPITREEYEVNKLKILKRELENHSIKLIEIEHFCRTYNLNCDLFLGYHAELIFILDIEKYTVPTGTIKNWECFPEKLKIH